MTRDATTRVVPCDGHDLRRRRNRGIATTSSSPASRSTPRRHEVAACERVLSRFDPRQRPVAAQPCRRRMGRRRRAAHRGARGCASRRARIRTDCSTRRSFPHSLPSATTARSNCSRSERPRRSTAGMRGARIDVDPGRGRARVEQDAAVDLGGIGKGFAATRALARDAHRLARADRSDSSISAATSPSGATPPEGGPWRVDIADPRAHGPRARDARAHERRRRHVGTRHAAVRPRPAAPPPHRPGDGRARRCRPARGHGRGRERHGGRGVRDRARESRLSTRRATCSPHAPMLRRCSIPQVGEPVAIGRSPARPDRPRQRLVVNTQVGRFPWH